MTARNAEHAGAATECTNQAGAVGAVRNGADQRTSQARRAHRGGERAIFLCEVFNQEHRIRIG